MTPKALPHLAPRKLDSHKGDYGRALLIGGSRGMSGAIALTAMATLRGGAGLVTVATPDACADVVASFHPSYMTLPLASDADGRIGTAARGQIEDIIDRFDVIACGPGMGRSDAISELVTWIYETMPKPMVVDADGLNALGPSLTCRATDDARPSLTRRATMKESDRTVGPRILTPHLGEFQRLLGRQLADEEDRDEVAKAFAAETETVLVLKGHQTIVTDGLSLEHNSTGNPGMATGGSGDVLTGLVTALLCQHLSPLDAAWLGVYLHGLAGDLAAEQVGQVSLLATDLCDHLPQAFQILADRQSESDSNTR